MSYLHIKKGGREETVYLQDGNSDSLHRHVDLDTGTIVSYLGKQLAGKNIDPNGTLGRSLLVLSEKLITQADKQ